MKPFYVVLLMGAAALGGGLVVRYSDHPVEITMAQSSPPPSVVAPPTPSSVHVGASTSVPVHGAPPPAETRATPQPAAREENRPAPKPDEKSARKPEVKPSPKPSVFGPPPSERIVSEPRIIARVKIPPDPPAVIPLERTVTTPTPAPAPAPKDLAAAPAPVPAPQAKTPAPAPLPQPEANHATLTTGMLINVRINSALSSNLNSPGDVFLGRLDRPLVAGGFVIAERGAEVRGEVVESRTPAYGQGPPELTIRLREILASDGQRIHLVSEPWRKLGGLPNTYNPNAAKPANIYDTPLTRNGAAVIRPATTIPFKLSEKVELTEKR
ncbi:MAG TPA: hypothetical protein VGL72_32915 [Bryobacteraceae bacterium]|jgi:hypothetical protein